MFLVIIKNKNTEKQDYYPVINFSIDAWNYLWENIEEFNDDLRFGVLPPEYTEIFHKLPVISKKDIQKESEIYGIVDGDELYDYLTEEDFSHGRLQTYDKNGNKMSVKTITRFEQSINWMNQ